MDKTELTSRIKVKNIIALFIIVILSFASCIEIHARLKLNSDGSGRGKIEYVVAKGIYSAPDDAQLAINEDKIAETVAKKDGVRVIRSGSNYENENMVRVWVDFEFEDISKLSDAFLHYRFENIGDRKKELRIKYILKGELHKREMLKSMFKELVSDIEIELPGKIIATNGKILSSNRVRWEIPAVEVVGRDVSEDLVVQFEIDGKKNIIQRIKEMFKK